MMAARPAVLERPRALAEIRERHRGARTAPADDRRRSHGRAVHARRAGPRRMVRAGPRLRPDTTPHRLRARRLALGCLSARRSRWRRGDDRACGGDRRGRGLELAVASRSDSTMRGHFRRSPTRSPARSEAPARPSTASTLSLLPRGRAADRRRRPVGRARTTNSSRARAPPMPGDRSFGYSASNLRRWVEEKTGGAVRAADVLSLGLEDIRGRRPGARARDPPGREPRLGGPWWSMRTDYARPRGGRARAARRRGRKRAGVRVPLRSFVRTGVRGGIEPAPALSADALLCTPCA